MKRVLESDAMSESNFAAQPQFVLIPQRLSKIQLNSLEARIPILTFYGVGEMKSRPTLQDAYNKTDVRAFRYMKLRHMQFQPLPIQLSTTLPMHFQISTISNCTDLH